MRNLIFLITAIGLLPVRVRAQDAVSPPASDEDVVTAPVEVRGTRDSEPQAAGGERALEEPGFVTVVDIDRRRDETASIAEALAETGSPDAVPVLRDRLAMEPIEQVRLAIAEALRVLEP